MFDVLPPQLREHGWFVYGGVLFVLIFFSIFLICCCCKEKPKEVEKKLEVELAPAKKEEIFATLINIDVESSSSSLTTGGTLLPETPGNFTLGEPRTETPGNITLGEPGNFTLELDTDSDLEVYTFDPKLFTPISPAIQSVKKRDPQETVVPKRNPETDALEAFETLETKINVYLVE